MATAPLIPFQTSLLSIRRDKSTDVQILSQRMIRNGASLYRQVSHILQWSAEGSQSADGDVSGGSVVQAEKAQSDRAVLDHLKNRSNRRGSVSIGEMRDTLRRAAALLCKARTDQSALVHLLVGVPFTTFTKQSIKLGISLWLGVINENPQMESRILTEVAEQWEHTVRNRIGAFSSKLQ